MCGPKLGYLYLRFDPLYPNSYKARVQSLLLFDSVGSIVNSGKGLCFIFCFVVVVFYFFVKNPHNL